MSNYICTKITIIYRTYENVDLSASATLKVEHTIIINETDILNLISQPRKNTGYA